MGRRVSAREEGVSARGWGCLPGGGGVYLGGVCPVHARIHPHEQND